MRIVSGTNRVYVHTSKRGTRAYIYHGETEVPDDVAMELIAMGKVKRLGSPATGRMPKSTDESTPAEVANEAAEPAEPKKHAGKKHKE